MHGVAAVEESLRTRRDVGPARLRRERQDPHIRPRRIDDPLEHEADGQRVVLHAFDDLLVASLPVGLQADIGARPLNEGRVPLLAAHECFALDQIGPVA